MDWNTGGWLTGAAAIVTALGVWWKNRGSQKVSETEQIIRGLHGVATELREHASALLDRARQAEIDLEECETERRSNRRRIDDLEENAERQQRIIDEQQRVIAEQGERIAELERMLNGS